MKITRLSWASLKIELSELTILIDPVEDYSSIEKYMGKPRAPIFPFSENTSADIILLTHLHPDHYDPRTIRKVLKDDGTVFIPAGIKESLKTNEFKVIEMQVDDTIIFATFRITALFAMDGIGDKQVAWLLEANGKKIYHGGDTIWHNQFWNIGKNHGPIDAAFMPINGVSVDYPFVGYTPLPVSLLPGQAAAAARIMKVQNLVPIHYSLFNTSPVYSEYPDALMEFKKACDYHNQPYIILQEGEELTL